tara:strand:+ start:109 stop:537 length:429 start_codon:yes stop_codon:yes gene_type:complete
MFPQLGAKSVKLRAADGKEYICPMMGIGDLDNVNDIIESTAAIIRKETQVTHKDDQGNEIIITDLQEMTAEEAEDMMVLSGKRMIEARDRIFVVIKPYLPEEVYNDLFRLSYDDAVALANYLAYGDKEEDSYSSEEVDTKKK